MGANDSRPVRDQEDEMMRFQMRREATIITEDFTCAADIVNALGLQPGTQVNPEEILDNLDQFATKYKLETGFYDPEFLRALSCLLKVGLTVDSQLSASKYVKEFFTDHKQIGAISVEGVALMSGVKANKNMFVVKAPRNPGGDNLIHEYFVAAGGAFTDLNGQPKMIIGTNWLRKVCPSYAQIMGAFRCGPPEIDPLSKRLRDWCSTENPASYVNYVVYEKIDGPDLDKLSPTIDAATFVTSIIQLCYALEIGQIYNGFTHYDLHHQNVIMRELHPENKNTELLIPFVTAGDLTIYVKSHYIPTIIDFGHCHIQSPAPALEMMGEPTEHFGYRASFARKYGIDADRSRPYYDIYKVIGFTLFSMLQGSNPAFEQVWMIMGFFGLRTRDQVVQWLNKSRTTDLFSLSEDAERMGFCLTKQMAEGLVCLPEAAATMNDLLEYIEAQFPEIWQAKVFGYPIAGDEILQCGADCTNFEGAISNMTAEKAAKGLTGLEAMNDFRDVMRYRNNVEHRAIYFEQNFPQSQYGPKLMREVEKLDAEIVASFEQTNGPYAQQIIALGEQVKAAYQAVGYPLVFSDAPSNDFNVIAQELQRIFGYLDRMSEFAKAYVEFMEFYEAGEDMTRIAGKEPSADLTEYHRTQISPLFQAYDNSRGEIRRILERTPIPPEYAEFKQALLVRTM